MKNIIYSLLLVFLPVILHAGGGDAQSYTIPPCFIHNAGQWESSIRYALLGGNGSIWFRDDGIVIARPRVSKQMPSVEPSGETQAENEFELVQLRFENPSPRMRLRAMDTASAVSHFYLHADSARWRDNVANHRRLRYENVWDGVDLEFDVESAKPDAGWTDVVPASNGCPAVRMRDRQTESSGRRGYELTQNNISSAFSYDSPALSTFMSLFGIDQSGVSAAKGEANYIYLFGGTHNPLFPLLGAWHSTYVQGNKYHFIIKYNPANREVLYSTYFGPVGDNPAIHTDQYLDVFNGQVHVFGTGMKGFPVNRVLPGSSEPDSTHTQQAVIFSLTASGALAASSYIGGPGRIYPFSIHRRENELYVFGTVKSVNQDSVRSITDDAIERNSYFGWDASLNYYTSVFGIISVDLDTTKYMTYLWPATNSSGVYLNGGYKLAMHVRDADGSAVFIFGLAGYNPPLRNTLVTLEQLAGYGGAYIAKYSRIKNDYEYATLYGFEACGFGYQASYLTDNGHLFLMGTRCRWAGGFSLPGNWTQIGTEGPVIPGDHPTRQIIGAIDAYGRSIGGFEILMALSNGAWRTGSIAESMCGMLLFTGSLKYDGQISDPDTVLPLLNAFDSISIANRTGVTDHFLIAVDPARMELLYSSFWNHRYKKPRNGAQIISNRPNGYVLYWDAYQPEDWNVPIDWRILGSQADVGAYMVDIRIPTPCWRLGCEINSVDTLRIEKVRGYSEPRVIEVEYLVPNLSPEKAARILQAMIELPPGFELIGGTLAQPMVPSDLYAGNTARCSWRVRVLNPAVLGDTARIRCRVMYIDPESGQTWPIAEEVCEHILHVVRYDETDPRLSCTVEGPDSLYWTGSGYASEPGGEAGLIRYTASYTNVSGDTVDVEQYRQSASTFCRVARNSFMPGNLLLPGGSYGFTFDVRLDALRYDRNIVVRSAAVDAYGLPWSDCDKITYIPGIPEMPCTVTGPNKIVWNTATGTVTPALPSYTLTLDNPLDTIRVDIRARLDLALAQHLAPVAGEQLLRDPFTIAAHAQEQRSWQLELSNPPTRPTADTLYFFYTIDGATYYCTKVVEIDVIDQTVLCSITAPQTLTEEQLKNHENVQLDYTLSNAGTIPVGITRIDLAISPTAGVLPLDPLSQPGATIAPNSDIALQWRLRPLALRHERTAHFEVTAYGTADSILSVCTHDMHIPGIEGLLCDITAPDTVRFIRDELRYEPDPVKVTLDLRNILDTEEIQIEAEIDLANAPRFDLATGETAIKTLASIDSNSTVQLRWLLHLLPDTLMEAQDITIRYRSLEQAEWKECNAKINIEAWPLVQTTHCVVSGHDSLHIDPFYELIIPEPFEISYTATNTGTVALHNCATTIILPPEFELVSDSATLSFGDLLPNTSSTRWWSLKTTASLSGAGTFPVNFTWRRDEQGSVTGCEHRVHVIAGASSGIVFTPLHLHFEAKKDDPLLPAAQYVDLWTGGGLSMPWTAQGGQWWLDVDPVVGDRAARIAVQPTTTALPFGLHATAISIAGQAPNLPKDITVTYEITGLVGVVPSATATTFGLGHIWPQPVALNGEARVTLNVPSGEYVRLTIHDALGRETALLHEGAMFEQDRILRFIPSAHRMSAGMYFLRLSSGAGQAVRVVVVRP